MNTSFWRRGGRLWVQGAVLLLLRLWQNRAGFDPVTGLSVRSLPGLLLLLCLLFSAALELIENRRMPKGKAAYADQFEVPDHRMLPAAAAGCLLLAAGGLLLALKSLLARNVLAIAAGALGIAAGVGLLILLRRARAGRELSVLLSLPAILFGVGYLLTVYIPMESDPVLARTSVPILAAALAALAFSQLGGFLLKDSSPRTFGFTAGMAVILCITSAADGGAPRVLLYTGCALTLTVFRLLCRDTAPDSEAAAPENAASRGSRRQRT